MYALKAATLALNMAFAMFAGWVVSAGMNAFINWMKNAKTHSEQLISTMEDAHDAAEEAQQDVDDIQQKLDDLDQKVKDLGAEKIEDIVDPQEKTKIQEINNLLETQLRLKKQIADDENNKANNAASDVFNDKSEVVTSNETPSSYAEADPNGIGVTVTPSKNVTRTEALQEHTNKVNELSDAYEKLLLDESAIDEERAQAKKNLEDEISLTNDAGTKVSELADMYESDASNYGDVSAEVQECTESMQGASDALERANNLLNGTVDVNTKNVDAFAEKVKTVKAAMSRRGETDSKGNAYIGAVNEFSGMTGEAVLNIDADTEHQTEAEANALKILHETADNAKISFEDLIGVFEQFGLLQVSNTSEIANYATQLEETMKAIDSLQSSYKTCSTAVEEYNQYGYLSTDTMQSLLQMDTEYLNCLDLKDGKLQINKQRYAELLAAQYAQAEMEAIEQAITELNTIAKEDSAEKTESLTTATEDEKNKLVALCPALKDATTGTGELAAALAAAQSAADGGNADEIQAKIDSVMNALNTKLTLLHDNMSAAISNGNALGNQLGGFSKNTKSASKSVSDAASAFDTLSKAMKEYNQYGYICADTMKSLAGLEDKYTACLTEQNGKLVLNTAQFRKFIKAQLDEANAADDSGKSAHEMQKILDWLNSSVNSETISFEQLTDAIKGYGTAMDEAKEKTDAIKSAFSDLAEIGKNKIENPFGALDADDVDKQYQAIRNLYENTDLFTNPDFAGALNPETGTIDYNSDAFKQAFLSYLDDMITACETTGGKAGAYLAQGFKDAKEKIAGNVISIEEYIKGIGSTLDSISNDMDNFQSAFNDLSDIVDEYNAYGDLSQDSIQKLMGLDVKYTACLDLQGDKLVFNKEAFRALYVAELQELALKYEGTDLGKRYAEILQKVADGTWDVTDHMKGMGTEAEKLKSAFSDLKDIFSSLLDIFENFNSNKDSDLKLWGEAMTEDIDKRIDALNEQKEALENANDEEERAITLAKLQAELEKARTQRTVRKLTSNGYEWVVDESAVKEAQDNLNDQQRSWNKEDAEKAIDDQIDKLNELKDKYSEIIDLIGTDLDDYNKKLKYASEIAGMTFTEMESRVDIFKSNVLGSMSTAKPISSIKNVISSLESLIGTLEKVNNVFEWAQSGFTDYQDKGLQGLFNTVKKFFGNDGAGGDIGTLFENGWNAIADGAKSLFTGTGGNNLTTIFSNGLSGIGSLISKAFNGFGKLFSSGGSGILSGIGKIFTNIGSAIGIGGVSLSSVPAMTTANTAGLTGLARLTAKAGIDLGVAGTGTAVGGGLLASASSLPVIGAVVAGAALGVNSTIQRFKGYKDIWSSNDNTGTKLIKSVGNFLWHTSPIGVIADGVKTIGGWVKKIFGIQDKKSQTGADSASANGKINVGDIVINSPDKPASAEKQTQQQQTNNQSPWKRFWSNFWGSKFWFWNWGKKASGSKYIEESAPYNVDEQGSELIVRKPESGRYTYLETGDGVVPADITSKLFEMGGNPDKWFNDQLAKHSALSNIQNHTVEGDITVGDIYIQNPVGDTDTLAKEIIRDLPIKLRQERGRR